MKYVLLIVSVIAGLFIISFITEAVEFTTVLYISNLSMDELYRNQPLYLELRNQVHILLFKLLYTTLAGFTGGYITVFISHHFQKTAAFSLLILQTVSMGWAAFFSGLSATLPLWTWVSLIVLVPSGVFAGFYMRIRRLK